MKEVNAVPLYPRISQRQIFQEIFSQLKATVYGLNLETAKGLFPSQPEEVGKLFLLTEKHRESSTILAPCYVQESLFWYGARKHDLTRLFFTFKRLLRCC